MTSNDIEARWSTFQKERKSRSGMVSDIEIKSWDQTCDSDSKMNNEEFCTSCNSEIRMSELGYFICSSNTCGRIYKDILDRTAEWRYYNGEGNVSDPTRCGMPINPLLKESSFGCRILTKGNTSYEMRKIRRYTEWQSMPYREKSQYDEFERIKEMANKSGISKCIVDDALHLHKKISEEKTFRALNRDGVIAASLYISSRMNNYPRTAKEIATIFKLDKSSATRGCKNATTILNKIEKDLPSDMKTKLCPTKPITFIDRYCSKLNINKDITTLCKFIAFRIEERNLIPENNPHSIAAGVVYFVSQLFKLNISKTDVGHISEISEVTINKCCKKLVDIKDKLLPSKDLLFSGMNVNKHISIGM